jgi:predicted nucleotidyltransferase
MAPRRLANLLREKREEILALAERHGARDVRVFGSVARGEETDASDVDLLVRMEKGRSLLDLIGFELAVADLLGGKVDVASDGCLSPHIEERVHAEARLL